MVVDQPVAVVNDAIAIEILELNVTGTIYKVPRLQFSLGGSRLICELVNGKAFVSNYFNQVAISIIHKIIHLVQAVCFITPNLTIRPSDIPLWRGECTDALCIAVFGDLGHSIREGAHKT